MFSDMAVSAAITLVTNAAAPPPSPGGTVVNWQHLTEAVPSVELIAALVAIGAELLGHVPDGIGPASYTIGSGSTASCARPRTSARLAKVAAIPEDRQRMKVKIAHHVPETTPPAGVADMAARRARLTNS